MRPANDLQSLTLSLGRQTIDKARMLAAERSISVGALVREQIELLVREEDELSGASVGEETSAEAKARVGPDPLQHD